MHQLIFLLVIFAFEEFFPFALRMKVDLTFQVFAVMS